MLLVPLTISIRLEELNTSNVFGIEFLLPCFEVLYDSVQMFIREIKAFGIEIVGI